ncbi:hypothetical protein R69658_06931 [Paraburkholderia aspalathi]|uniref:Transposase n=1 Tax=Paraburkholderia aspalathi TaxID=1324617 RepID=A0ABM8SZS3_9BURK|nr:hypothetical protein R69658_06931 [Paraburkholderia aspalathi]
MPTKQEVMIGGVSPGICYVRVRAQVLLRIKTIRQANGNQWIKFAFHTSVPM